MPLIHIPWKLFQIYILTSDLYVAFFSARRKTFYEAAEVFSILKVHFIIQSIEYLNLHDEKMGMEGKTKISLRMVTVKVFSG